MINSYGYNIIDAIIFGPYAPWFVLAVIVIAIFFCLYYFMSSREEKKRIEELKEIALRSGFSYSANADIKPEGFEIFNIGKKQKAWNMLTIRKSPVVWRIFDYIYFTSAGRHRFFQTVFLAETTRSFPKFVLTPSLPKFVVRADIFLNQLGNLAKYKDIDFDNHQNFSNKYFLKGSDEKAIRNVFNNELIGDVKS